LYNKLLAVPAVRRNGGGGHAIALAEAAALKRKNN